MNNLLILFVIIFGVLISHYYITKKVESFFNYSNDSWGEDNIEEFYSSSKDQMINPALIERKKKIDTALLPIESSNLDNFDSYAHPYGILNNENKKIDTCQDLNKHRGGKWNPSYTYKDPACCNTKSKICCCLGNNCGSGVGKCSDLINLKGNNECDLNTDNNCIKPVLNNYTNKSRDIWGKNGGKWKYTGVDQDMGVLNTEKYGVQPFKEIPKKFCCRDGSKTAKGYTFYKGCTTCQTNNFNGNNYSPWGKSNAESYCMSWGSNRGKNISDVFTEGECF
jgi:hypothetical protein